MSIQLYIFKTFSHLRSNYIRSFPSLNDAPESTRFKLRTMASPNPKTEKITHAPVIFQFSPGQPDVRFKLFGEYEFHAHSWVLKEHSQFFLKFLDPLNKKAVGDDAASNLSQFRYEWVSQVDGDQESWYMVAASSVIVGNLPSKTELC